MTGRHITPALRRNFRNRTSARASNNPHSKESTHTMNNHPEFWEPFEDKIVKAGTTELVAVVPVTEDTDRDYRNMRLIAAAPHMKRTLERIAVQLGERTDPVVRRMVKAAQAAANAADPFKPEAHSATS